MGSKKSTNVTIVGAKSVRAWAKENMDTVSKLTVTKTVKGETVETPVNLNVLTGGPQKAGRGRIAKGSPIVAAFLAANPGTAYAEKVESVPTIEVPLFNVKGNRTGRKASIPLSDFRSLSGQDKGRPSSASVEAAGRALSEQRRKA